MDERQAFSSARDRRILFFTAALLLALPQLRFSGAAIAAQPPMRIFSSEPACETCSISLRRVADLRLPTDSLSFNVGTLSKITRLPDGRFIAIGLNETPVPALLSATGEFVKLLANRGRGPGEIERADRVVVAPYDTIWVLDRARRHVFAPNLAFVRTDGFMSTGDLIVGPGGRVAFNDLIATPDRAGYPLHTSSPDGALLRSFGLQSPVIDPRALSAVGDNISRLLLRYLVPGDSGTFWTYNPTRFLLEQYDFDGHLRSQARHKLDGWYEDASATFPGEAEFTGRSLSVVVPSREPDLLWLVYHVRNSTFRRADSAFTPTVNDIISMSDVVIEAFNVRTASVVAMLRLSGTGVLRMKHAPDIVALYQPLDEIFMSYRVMELSIDRREP